MVTDGYLGKLWWTALGADRQTLVEILYLVKQRNANATSQHQCVLSSDESEGLGGTVLDNNMMIDSLSNRDYSSNFISGAGCFYNTNNPHKYEHVESCPEGYVSNEAGVTGRTCEASPLFDVQPGACQNQNGQHGKIQEIEFQVCGHVWNECQKSWRNPPEW